MSPGSATRRSNDTLVDCACGVYRGRGVRYGDTFRDSPQGQAGLQVYQIKTDERDDRHMSEAVITAIITGGLALIGEVTQHE